MKTFKSLLALLALLFATFSHAETYTQETFDNLLKAGKPTLVQVHADWCSTCKKQAPIVSALLKLEPYRQIRPLRVDFDKQKDVLKILRASKQSTLIVFKDGKEVGRSLGDTSQEGIENLLKKAI